MKHRRAPLPVSSALWKGLLRKGFPKRLDELATFARRYLFLGDERLLLAELRIRTATTPPVRETLSKESEIAAEKRRSRNRTSIGELMAKADRAMYSLRSRCLLPAAPRRTLWCRITISRTGRQLVKMLVGQRRRLKPRRAAQKSIHRFCLQPNRPADDDQNRRCGGLRCRGSLRRVHLSDLSEVLCIPKCVFNWLAFRCR